jgi:hypothetical protein
MFERFANLNPVSESWKTLGWQVLGSHETHESSSLAPDTENTAAGVFSSND